VRRLHDFSFSELTPREIDINAGEAVPVVEALM
jgi:hypothetical protein